MAGCGSAPWQHGLIDAVKERVFFFFFFFFFVVLVAVSNLTPHRLESTLRHLKGSWRDI
jgi:hypothetical protein